MKRTLLTIFVIVFAVSVSAQLEVKSSGDTYAAKNIYLGGSASNFLGTDNSNVPIVFKVNNVLSGFTGSANTTNVSFGYQSFVSNTTGVFIR